MNEMSNTFIEMFQRTLDFFSNNSLFVFSLVLLITCRNSISSFINRLTSLSFKKGDSTLGMEAISSSDDKKRTEKIHSEEEKPRIEEKVSKANEVEKDGNNLMAAMHFAFSEKRFDDADEIFKKYSLDENDDIELEKNKAFYLYLRFIKAKDNKAIKELEHLVRIAKTEKSKLNSRLWLSICFEKSGQSLKEIDLWRSAIDETHSEELKTEAIVYLATALNADNKSIEAKKILIKQLSKVTDDEQKSKLYEALSFAEKGLGNTLLSIYCNDKSLEFDVNNRDKLFSSAYDASEEDIDEISISNYIRLIRIDDENSIAINNLGVRAQEAGLKIQAVENYKKSSKLNNTLSMANQGYLLLEAGFIEEAENIAKEALALDSPHKNIYSLMTAINEKKQHENKEWLKIREKSFDRQKSIREYTEQYYTGNPNLLKGNWIVNGLYLIKITIENDKIRSTWVEYVEAAIGGGSYEVKLNGKVSGSTFEGKYTRTKDESDTILSGFVGNIFQLCIGYITDDGNRIDIVSKAFKDDFFLSLHRPKANKT